MQTLLVASRKGLFVVRGQGTQWDITAHHFAGDPVTQVLVDPRNDHWYAALRMGHFGVKLRKSTNRGESWTEIASPAFPPKPDSGPLAADTTPWNVELIWSLAAGGADSPARCGPVACLRACSSLKTVATAGRSTHPCGKTPAGWAGLVVATIFRACTRCWWTHAMRTTFLWPFLAEAFGKPPMAARPGR